MGGKGEEGVLTCIPIHIPSFPDRPVGLVVKASASRANKSGVRIPLTPGFIQVE